MKSFLLLLVLVASFARPSRAQQLNTSDAEKVQFQLDHLFLPLSGFCPQQSTQKPKCTTKVLTKNCDIFDSGKPTILTPGGLEIKNPAFFPHSTSPTNTLPTLSEGDASFTKLEDFAKNEIIKLITKGKPQEEWTSDESSMVTRVKTVQIRLLTGNDTPPEFLDPKRINGAYFPQYHTIVIPKEMGISPSTYLLTLSHEIAHSIDPCNVQFPLYSVDGETL